MSASLNASSHISALIYLRKAVCIALRPSQQLWPCRVVSCERDLKQYIKQTKINFRNKNASLRHGTFAYVWRRSKGYGECKNIACLTTRNVLALRQLYVLVYVATRLLIETYLSHLDVRKPTMCFPNRSDTNRAVQTQKMKF